MKLVVSRSPVTMVDKELAMKLAKRFNQLSFEMDNRAYNGLQGAQQTILPEQSSLSPPPPPPPPLGQQQIPPFQAVPENEWTDMDKLIGQTLQNLEIIPRKTSNAVLTSMDYTPESLEKSSGSINNISNSPPHSMFCFFNFEY